MQNNRFSKYVSQPSQGYPSGIVPLTPPKPQQAPAGYRWGVNGALEPIQGGPADPSRPQPVEAPKPDLPEGWRMGPGGVAEPIPGLPPKAPSATEIEIADKGESARKRASTIGSIMGEVRNLYERDIKGQPASRLFGATEKIDSLPANERFRAAGMNILPLIRPLVAQTAKEGDSDKEMEIFLSYIPSNDDSDVTIENKFRMLEILIGGMVDGQAPSQALSAQSGARQTQGVNLPGSGGGIDATQQRIASPGGGQGMELNDGSTGYRREDDPTLKGVNARVNKMLKDGAPIGEVARYLQSVGVPPNEVMSSLQQADQFRKQNPNYRGDWNVNIDDRLVPMGATQQILNSAAQSPLGAYAINAADSATLGTLDNFTSNPALTRAGIDGVRQQNPMSSMLGSLTGGALAAGGAELGAGRLGLQGVRAMAAGDAAFGAAYGAGSADDGNRLLGAGAGAVAGYGGGAIGRTTQRAVGRAVTGARSATTRYLNDRNIPLTVGQIAGQGGRAARVVKSIEDKLESIPVLGDAIRSRRAEGYTAFNRQAFEQALEPIGVNAASEIGEEGVESAQNAVSDAYTQALRGVSLRPDQTFVRHMRNAIARGQGLPGQMADGFALTVREYVAPALDNGIMTGEAFQNARRALREARSSMKGQPWGREYGNAIRQVEMALDTLVRRKAPDVIPALERADKAYRRTKVVAGAVEKGVNTGGSFTPAQLGLAARSNAKKFEGNGATTSRPFYDLQRNAQEVLPSQIPNSGTADRAFAGAALPAALGGTSYGMGWIGPEEAALMASLGLPYTAAGARALQKIMLSRSPKAKSVGEGIIKYDRVGGLFGAGGAPLLLGGY